MKLLPGLALLLPLLATAACGDTVHINDSIDLDFDFDLTPPSVDADLHRPYVIGSQIDIHISDSDEDVRVDQWHVASADPSIFQINKVTPGDRTLSLDCLAAGPGSTEIIVYNGEHERARARVEVAVPDRVELDAHAWMIIGQGEKAPASEARLVEGGTATYLVRYFLGGRELFGNGALAVVAPEGVVAEKRRTFLFEQREWLTLTGSTPGQGTLELGAHDRIYTSLPLTVVPTTDIDRVEIHGSDESRAQKDQYLVALAQAYDAQDRRIFGVEYRWSVDSVLEAGDGDLYRYKYKPGQTAMLIADDGTHSAAAPLHVGEGYVDSSNNVGCAIAAPGRAGHGRATSSVGLAVFGLALFVARRRRARAAAQ